MKEAYWNKALSQKKLYNSHLRGLSHVELTRQRGFKGAKFGPANEGRKLKPDEKLVIEKILRDSGTL